MAGSATIGALRVDLGLNSAQFTAGLKKAQTGLGNFGAIAARSFAALAAGATLAAGALGIAVKGAIDHADALAKSAQKAGTTVEALSRLEFAAKLSDVSLESLTGGLQKLGKSMSDAIITPTSNAATAFKALGIALTNSDGTLRNSDQVLADIAERFARLEDGSTKTALAMQMFGKSGAELIPLLNSGRDGLKSMADESDRLGATISTKTAKAAEQFNDTLTRIQTVMQGVANKVMEAALPALQGLADTLASPEFAASAQTFSTNIITAMAEVVKWIANVKSNWNDLVNFIHNPTGLKLFRQTSTNIEDRTKPGDLANRTLGGASGQLMLNSTFDALSGSKTYGSTGEMWKALKPYEVPPFQTDAAVKSLEPLDLGIETTTDKVTTLADTIGGPLSNAISGFADAVLSGTNPLKAFGDQLGNIGKSLMNAGIQGLVNSLLGGITGGMGGGAFAGSAFRFGGPSFDGGGYTGMGSRAGGIDGKGGFLATLHPNETVLDHSKGQGGGTGSMTFNFYEVNNVEQMRQWARSELPGIVRRINSDPYAVG